MADTEPTGGRGTGEEQDWHEQSGPRGASARPEDAGDERTDAVETEDRDPEGAPDIGTAGAFPALANDALAKDPDVPTDVDGDPAPGGEPDLRDA
ncbi:hypothetical protein [Cellulosimicrobium marinum]|uniref:hypothetical protein n=1 Tax=Cellulosimicrobium marinum TaxID=1638992 RepID=UPI001E2A4B42|nr:hypothetical protein [Cellulosimicrobium marinum]MCB7136163.1 hypothetical protein [Cellulosimicrobium marinum]